MYKLIFFVIAFQRQLLYYIITLCVCQVFFKTFLKYFFKHFKSLNQLNYHLVLRPVANLADNEYYYTIISEKVKAFCRKIEYKYYAVFNLFLSCFVGITYSLENIL